MPGGSVTGAASQGPGAKQEQLSPGRGKWSSSCFCRPGNLKQFLPRTGSFVLQFDFCLCVSGLSDISGTLF